MSSGKADRGVRKWIKSNLSVKDVSGIVSDYVHNELMNWDDLTHHEMCVIVQRDFSKFSSWAIKNYR
jgi:hypothetical protein